MHPIPLTPVDTCFVASRCIYQLGQLWNRHVDRRWGGAWRVRWFRSLVHDCHCIYASNRKTVQKGDYRLQADKAGFFVTWPYYNNYATK
jgi:hypothetical protein